MALRKQLTDASAQWTDIVYSALFEKLLRELLSYTKQEGRWLSSQAPSLLVNGCAAAGTYLPSFLPCRSGLILKWGI